MNTAERIKLSAEEMESMMPPGECVHTFMQCGVALLGADWKRSEILATAARNGAEISGEQATAMKHGIVIWHDDGSPVFVATL